MQRILFDRSIFHGSKFEQLRSCGISAAAKSGRFKIFLTSRFVEETLRYAFRHENEFMEQWDFVNSFIGAKWFKPPELIVPIELSDSIKGSRYFLRPKAWVQQARVDVLQTLKSRWTPDQLEEPLAELKFNQEARREFRQMRLELRLNTTDVPQDFLSFFESNVEWVIREAVMTLHPTSGRFLETWRTKRNHCLFTEQFLKSFLATIYLPIKDHQMKVDENDRVDAEQLAYLIWADTIVSDDLHFMKKGFDLLYGSGPKQFLTLREFLALIPSIS